MGRYHLTILHVLCDAVVQAQAITIARGVFFNKEKRGCLWAYSLGITRSNDALLVSGEHEAGGLMNEIMEAAQQLGMTDVQGSRMLKRIRLLLGDVV